MLFYCCYGLFKAWLTLFCRLAITLLTSDPILERLVRGRLRAHRDCLPVLPVDRLFQMAPAIPPASISPNTRPVAASPAFCDCGWKHYFKKRFFKICSIRLKETPRYTIWQNKHNFELQSVFYRLGVMLLFYIPSSWCLARQDRRRG